MIAYRPATAEDEAFIYATWLRAQYYGTPFYRAMKASSFYQFYTPFVKIVLSSPDTVVQVACLADSPETILGYVVYSHQDVLHGVYVKMAWRRQGIAKTLLRGYGGFKTASALTSNIAALRHLEFVPLPLLFS